MRGKFTAVVVGLGCALGLTFGSPSANAGPSVVVRGTVPGQPSAPAVAERLSSLEAPCVDVVFMGAGGSGEDLATGRQLGTRVGYLLDSYAFLVDGIRLKYWPIRYRPAAPDVLRHRPARYWAQIDRGFEQAYEALSARAWRCPGERYVVAGYGQGAMVWHRALEALTPEQWQDLDARERFIGAALLADGDRDRNAEEPVIGSAPDQAFGVTWRRARIAQSATQHDASTGLLPARHQLRISSVCARGDAVCDAQRAFRSATSLRAGIRIHRRGYVRTTSTQSVVARLAGGSPQEPSSDFDLSTDFETTTPLGDKVKGQINIAGPVREPLTWSVESGELPPGLTPGRHGLEGVTTATGTFTFSLRVRDLGGQTDVSAPATIHVYEAEPLPAGSRSLWTSDYIRTLTADDAVSRIAFYSRNDGYVLDTRTGATTRLRPEEDLLADQFGVVISGDGSLVTFIVQTGSSPQAFDLYTYRIDTGEYDRITSGHVTSGGPQLSRDGRFVAFLSRPADEDAQGIPTESYNVRLADTLTGQVTQVTDTTGWVSKPAISADGGSLYFASASQTGDPSNPGSTVYRWDRESGTTTPLFVVPDERFALAVSDDGTRIALVTQEPLLPEDDNGISDVYLWDAADQQLRLVTDGGQAPRFTGADRYLSYVANPSTLVPNDSNRRFNAYLLDLETGITTRLGNDRHSTGSAQISSDHTRTLFHTNLTVGSRDEIYLGPGPRP